MPRRLWVGPPRACIEGNRIWVSPSAGLRVRAGAPAAVVSTAHKLARITYHLITHRVDYEEGKITESERHDRRRFDRRLRQQASELGYKLVPEAV